MRRLMPVTECVCATAGGVIDMHEMRAVYTLWLREIKRFYREKTRIIGMVMQPLLFLFLIGTGLSASLMEGEFDYVRFMYPGIICMTLLFTSVFSGLSVVRDREFGFLKEVMVAPITRTSIALGKTFGGSSVALLGGMILLFLSPLVGVTLSAGILLQLIPMMFLIAFAMTSMGILIAVPMESMEGFPMIMNFLIMPMFFLSGAIFPMENLPGWMSVLMRVNPLAYAVDSLRNIIYAGEGPVMMTAYSLPYNIAVLVIFAAVMNFLAVLAFNIKESN